jgi:hypothetical protein
MESIKNIQEEIIRLSEAIARLAQGDTQNSELQNELKLLSQDLLERVHLLKFAHQVFDGVEPEFEEQEEFISVPTENIEQQILDEDQQEDEIERFENEEENLEEEPEEIGAATQTEEQEKQEEQEHQESQEEQESIEEREDEVEGVNEDESSEEPNEEIEEEVQAVEKPETIQNTSDDKESLNDKISKLSKSDSLASKLQNQPIQNLKTAIGLNERFLFANELFQGDGAEYQRAIEEFNHLASMDDAVRLIEHKYQPNYKWDFDNHTVQNFIHYLQRRYSYRESA